jgi:hypothetical protein
MAIFGISSPSPELVVPLTWRQVARMLAPIPLLVLTVLVVTVVGGHLLGDPEAAPAGEVEPEAVIRPGNGPAVAATSRFPRIVSTSCWLSGPIEVAADGTGAFVVTSGARHVHCAGYRFRPGFTLRWPADDPPRTAPVPTR